MKDGNKMRGYEHRKRSKEKFGHDYAAVHKWVDAPSKCLGPQHRKMRHGIFDVFRTLLKKDLGHARAHWQHIKDDKRSTKKKQEKAKRQ